MNFLTTFENEDSLWSVCFDEHDGQDILNYLFDLWDDVEHLTEFFESNLVDLEEPYWQGISIDTAITLVQQERQFLEDKLLCVYYKYAGCDNVKFEDLFSKLHKNEYALKESGKKFWKIKLDTMPQILRLYAVELEDCHIIVSGAIKISKTMDRAHFLPVFAKLQQVQDFLNQEFIISKDGLIE